VAGKAAVAAAGFHPVRSVALPVVVKSRVEEIFRPRLRCRRALRVDMDDLSRVPDQGSFWIPTDTL